MPRGTRAKANKAPTTSAQSVLTPEQAYAKLQEWYGLKERIKQALADEAAALDGKGKQPTLVDAEQALRRELAAFYFPHAKEGVNAVDLGGGFELVLSFGIKRVIDEAALDAVKASDVKRHKLNMDELITYVPTLNVKAYKELSTEQLAFVAGFVTESPTETPTMVIRPREQAQASIPLPPPAAPSVATGPQVYATEDECQPSGYYRDADGVWWQLNDKGTAWTQQDGPPAAAAPPPPPPKPGKPAAPPPPDAPQLYPISLVEDETQVGQYFRDADGVWWCMGRKEWVQVNDIPLGTALEAQWARMPK